MHRSSGGHAAGLDVGIVGAGTAGAAAALFLARDGHRVTLYERVAEPAAVGAGIVLQPTGLAVLDELGVAEAVVRRGARLEGLVCTTAGGRTLFDLRYDDVDRRWFGLGVHRGVLFGALLDAVRAAPVAHASPHASAISLRLGVDVAAITPAPRGRSWLVDAGGARHGAHDLVVVADGARSQLAATGAPRTTRVYPWGALWFVGPDPERRFTGRLRQVVRGTQRLVGVLPTGRGPGEGDDGVPLVSLFWSVRADAVDAWRAAGLGPWKDEMRRYFPDADAILAGVRAPTDLLFTTYRDVAMPRWHSPGVVWLGDAAHATSPQLGQGCNLALCDARALAEALRPRRRLDDALAAYTASRRAHLDFYQLATRALTPFFQSDAASLGWARDVLMGATSGAPWVKRIMVSVMAGVRGGAWTNLPLDRVRLGSSG